MTKHSKNVTASPAFTYAERQRLDYGTKKQRVGRDSMRNFDSCALCLQTARDPQICDAGHLFCKECVLTDLLSQKKDMKRQQKLLDEFRAQEAAQLREAREAAKQRVLAQFQQAQSGIAPSKKRKIDSVDAAQTNDAEEEAFQAILKEKSDLAKSKLPNFWLPSETPNATPTKLSEVKLQSICRAAKDPSHPISLKSLLQVNFLTPGDVPGQDKEKGCPCCRRVFNNNVKAFVLKPCGHVLCSTCVDTLVDSKENEKPQCAHCATPLASKKSRVELQREGTGFASGGLAEVKRQGVAFQC